MITTDSNSYPSVNQAFISRENNLQEHDHSNQRTRQDAASPKMTNNHVRWTLRNSISSASIRRYRSPFRRSIVDMGTVNPQCLPSPSFQLFRRFYQMRSSLKRRRNRDSPENLRNSFSLQPNEKASQPLRIEITHVLMTILITIVSGCLLISMIFLDFAYLDDAMFATSIYDITRTHSNESLSLCLLYPKVCMMKGIVILIFVVITGILCYSILSLYIRARRHSHVLERKTDELEREKCLTEKLLHEILPPCVAKDLINGRKAPAEYYESVTVYFSDIVGFTIIASMCSPTETCEMLNRLYSIFDSILENFDVYKVETIGDAYMVVSGAPTRNGDKHPNEIVNMSLALIQCKQQVRVPRTSAELQLRIGIHTGPVCAAVIGSKMPRYCMFGDTVNVASRMESNGLPEHIHLSDDTYKKLGNRDQYIFEDRGEINVKGKGPMRTYFLIGKRLQEISKSRSNTFVRND